MGASSQYSCGPPLGSPRPATAQNAGRALCRLVAAGHLPLPGTMVRLLACLSHGSDYTGIVPVLGKLQVVQVTAEPQP